MARFNGGACGCYDPKSGKMLAEVRVPKEAGRQAKKTNFCEDGGPRMAIIFPIINVHSHTHTCMYITII